MSAWPSPYWDMVQQWRAIFAQPLADEAKQEACLAVLRSYVHQKAVSHIRHANPCLRFYADMISLRSDLFPRLASDEFGQLVIWPMFRAVDDWVRRNTEGAAEHAG